MSCNLMDSNLRLCCLASSSLYIGLLLGSIVIMRDIVEGGKQGILVAYAVAGCLLACKLLCKVNRQFHC